MATTIRLDGSALKLLLEADPDFKLELQRAVVAEVVRATFKSDLPTSLQTVIRDELTAAHAELIKAVKEDVAIRAVLNEAMSRMVQSVRSSTFAYQVQKELAPEVKQQIKAELDQKVSAHALEISKRLEKQLDETVKIVSQRVIGKMNPDAMLMSIEGAWKQEALRAVKADVLAQLNKAI